MDHAVIEGLGSYLPELVLTNADFEKMVDTSDEWIISRTGIRERRMCPKGQGSSDLGVYAARQAIQDAGISPSEIELILCSTISPDMSFPATSCLIQEKLGIEDCPCFDISAACSGFLYGLETARNFVETGRYKKVLVIASECMSRYLDYTDRSTCVLLGDGAVAAVLGTGRGHHILDVLIAAGGKYWNLLYVPAGGSLQSISFDTVEGHLHSMKMEGSALFRIAISAMADAAKSLLAKNGLTLEDIAFFIPHQANIRIIQGVAKVLSVPMERFFVNIEHTGNMSAASVGVALHEASQKKIIAPGDIVCLVTFGAGLTWAASLLRWKENEV
ncbi:MAG: beta-ketoacyl-ACP synthase III [Candidatus Ratteibacteria bacterium]